MARTAKNIVDYFPHQCTHGKTMFVLTTHYGNDGYAFWFILLEVLGRTENHFLDLRKKQDLLFLGAETRISEAGIILGILNLLADLEAIDSGLWRESQVVWVQNFVDGIADVYKRRGRKTPQKPVLDNKKAIPDDKNPITSPEMRQSKVKESKVKERESEKDVFPSGKILELWNQLCPHQKIRGITDKRRSHLKKRWSEWKDLEYVQELFRKITSSSFCRGENDRGWKADFDWIINNDTNHVKVMEGKYDDKETGKKKPSMLERLREADELTQYRRQQQ